MLFRSNDTATTEIYTPRHTLSLHNALPIFPFRLLTRLIYPLLAGDHPAPGGGILHVSRGTGTWGPPMRFLAPPEITVVDIVRSVPVGSYRHE